MTTTATPSYLTLLEPVITDVIAPLAGEIDSSGAYPRAALDAMGKNGLLGLISAREVGGLGESFRAAALVVDDVAYPVGVISLVGEHDGALGQLVEE